MATMVGIDIELNLTTPMQDILIPYLPNEISLSCIAKVPIESWSSLLSVSKAWLNLFASGKLYSERKSLGCQENIILAEFFHWEINMLYFYRKDCWLWFPQLKNVGQQEKKSSNLEVTWESHGTKDDDDGDDDDDEISTKTFYVSGPNGDFQSFNCEDFYVAEGCGKLVICFDYFPGKGQSWSTWGSFLIVDLFTMESMTVHSKIKSLTFFIHELKRIPTFKDGKMYLFGYSTNCRFWKEPEKIFILDLNTGLIEMKPLNEKWFVDFNFVYRKMEFIKDLIHGRIFCLMADSENIFVKYYKESTNEWVEVFSVSANSCGKGTEELTVKVTDDILYIFYQVSVPPHHYYSKPKDGDIPQKWFLSVLKVSEENGEILCNLVAHNVIKLPPKSFEVVSL